MYSHWWLLSAWARTFSDFSLTQKLILAWYLTDWKTIKSLIWLKTKDLPPPSRVLQSTINFQGTCSNSLGTHPGWQLGGQELDYLHIRPQTCVQFGVSGETSPTKECDAFSKVGTSKYSEFLKDSAQEGAAPIELGSIWSVLPLFNQLVL